MTRRRTLSLPALIVAAVLMACAAAVLAVPKEAEATFPGKNGKIAYQDFYDFGIYTINPNGSGKTKVTTPCVIPSLPDYSPTGKKITYTDCEGNAGNDTEIYTINVGGGDKFQVTNNNTEDSEPSYSPDGKKIVLMGWDRHDTEIYTINSDGTGKAQLTHNNTDDLGPSYSPDGKKIVFSSTVRNLFDHDSEIYTMSVNGKNRVRLTNNATYDYYPDYSQIGRRIAFAGTGENATHIYTIRAHGGDESKLSAPTGETSLKSRRATMLPTRPTARSSSTHGGPQIVPV